MGKLRWPPVDVLVFFAAAIGYQYWLFDGLTGGRLDDPWFHARFAVPIGLALTMAFFAQGIQGVRSIVEPLGRIPLGVGWWLLAIGWVPLLGALTTLIYPTLPGNPGPAPALRPNVLIPSLAFLLFVIQVSLADESAWIGYACGRVQTRWRALAACLFVGAFWGWWYQPMVGYGRAIAGTAIPVPLFIWTMMATAVVCVLLYNATRSALIVVAAQVAGNFFYLVFPVLPQATGSWFPYAVFCALQLVLVVVLVWLFGPELRPASTRGERAIWLWPHRWKKSASHAS